MRKYLLTFILSCLVFSANSFRFHKKNTDQQITPIKFPFVSDSYDFKTYSGYLDINSEISIFYIFIESQSNPQNDPLVLWLNGGNIFKKLI